VEFRVPKGHAISYSVAFAIRLLVLVQYMIVDCTRIDGNANPVRAIGEADGPQGQYGRCGRFAKSEFVHIFWKRETVSPNLTRISPHAWPKYRPQSSTQDPT